MVLSFLIPLFTGLITGYISKKSADEIAYFVGIFAVISLIISLVLAPWQFQVLLLIVVLIATKKLLQQNEYKLNVVEHSQEKLNSADNNELVSSQPNADKKILPKYRGASYQASDFINEITEAENPDKKRSIYQRSYQQAKTPELNSPERNITSKEQQASVDSNFAPSKSFNNNSIHHGDRIFLGRFFS